MFKKVIYIFLFLYGLNVKAIDMAITVDDLPVHGKLPANETRLSVVKKILGVLKKNKIPEVYGFINASKFEFEKDQVSVLEAWRASGYPLVNHTYSHMDLHKSSVEEFKKDIARNEQALKDLNGSLDWHYFRYPYLREGESLEKRNAIRAYLKEQNYKIAQVTVDFEDWAWNEPYVRCLKAKKKQLKYLEKSFIENADKKLDESVAITDYLFKRPVKHILLLHIGAFDAKMLSKLIALYKMKGIKFISLSEAVKDEIYQIDPGVAGKWGSELQFQIMKSKGLKMKDIGITATTSAEDEMSKICL